MTRAVAVALTLNFAFASVLSAQQPGPIRASLEREAARFASLPPRAPARAATPPDHRVRLTLKQPYAPKVVGVIDRVDTQTLTIVPESGPPITVSLDSIARVERPDGRRGRGRNASLGALIGIAGGYGVSRLTFDACRKSSFLCELTNVEHRLYGMTIGGVSGGLLGGFGLSQRWKTVTLSEISGAGRAVGGPPPPAR